jgi:Uma2 family endonuclease
MVVPKPWIKFTVKEYMSLPEGAPYQLLDGEMILAPSPTQRHQSIVAAIYRALYQFVSQNQLGQVWFAPLDVVLSDHDVAQPDLLFVSNSRSEIVTEANIQGGPDLVVEIISPGTAQYDRGYKQLLYGRHGVLEYWMVDPDAMTVEVMVQEDNGLTPWAVYRRGETMSSRLLQGFSIELGEIFGEAA